MRHCNTTIQTLWSTNESFKLKCNSYTETHTCAYLLMYKHNEACCIYNTEIHPHTCGSTYTQHTYTCMCAHTHAHMHVTRHTHHLLVFLMMVVVCYTEMLEKTINHFLLPTQIAETMIWTLSIFTCLRFHLPLQCHSSFPILSFSLM